MKRMLLIMLAALLALSLAACKEEPKPTETKLSIKADAQELIRLAESVQKVEP